MTTDLVMQIRFPRPAPTLSMNQRVHWRTRHRLTKLWRGTTATYAIAQLGRTPTARHREPCYVRVSFPVPDPGRRRDPHNLAPTVKACVDGLVDAGVWADDAGQYVVVLDPQFHHAPRDVIADVVITLYPIANGMPE